MSRLIIDVSGDQHQKIKAQATIQGKSVNEYVLDNCSPKEKIHRGKILRHS